MHPHLSLGLVEEAIAPTNKFSQKGDRTMPELSRRCDRLCKGHWESAIALTLEFSQKGDRLYKSHSKFSDRTYN